MYCVAVPTALGPEAHGQGAFTLYRVSVQAKTRCRVSGALPRTMSWSCDKRYSDFVALRQGLARIREPPQAVADVRALPALPPKVWLGSSLDTAVVETRRALLEQFLQRLVLIPAVHQLVAAFLDQPAELLMSSDEDEPVDEEEAAERAKKRRLAVLAEAERLYPRLYDIDDAVPTRELLDFILQSADTGFLKSRRMGTSLQQASRTWSRGRVVRVFKRLVGQLRCDVQQAAAPAAAGGAVERIERQTVPTKWHHTRRRLPTTGWSRFTDAQSVEGYYHGSTGLVTYEHIMLTGRFDRVAELRKEIERTSSALRHQQGAGVLSSSSSTAEEAGSVADRKLRELDAELAEAEREAAQVANAAHLEAEVHTLRKQRASHASVVPADRNTKGLDLQTANIRSASSLDPALPPAPQRPREVVPESEPPSPRLDLNGTCKIDLNRFDLF